MTSTPTIFVACTKCIFFHPRFLKVHELETLLKFSGLVEKVKVHYYTEWTLVSNKWSSENRYRKIGTETQLTAQAMLNAVKKRLTIL
jgi:hypothetical protein